MTLQDTDKMPFGVHEGKRVGEVPPYWFDWASEKFKRAEGADALNAVLDYIDRNRAEIDRKLIEMGLSPRGTGGVWG
jgi:hypothetical protein